MLSVILYLICPCADGVGLSAVVPTGICIDFEVSITKLEPSNVKNWLSWIAPDVPARTRRLLVKSPTIKLESVVSPLTVKLSLISTYPNDASL